MFKEIDEALRDLKEKGGDPANIFPGLMETTGSLIAGAFGVRNDEVAVLLVNSQNAMFRFVYPDTLYKAGTNTFPVSAASIAGQTFRTRKGRAYNDVTDVRHLSVYERVQTPGGPILHIQKLISAPLVLPDETPIGVIQVSRKGKTTEEAGPDFTDADLARLNEACRELAPRINGIIPADL